MVTNNLDIYDIDFQALIFSSNIREQGTLRVQTHRESSTNVHLYHSSIVH